jgi:tellurite resistance protein TehA-like permease
MKNMIALICQLVGFFLVLAFFFSLANYFFGWHLGMKGAEVPADPRAAALFLMIGLASGSGAYLLGRSNKDQRVKKIS